MAGASMLVHVTHIDDSVRGRQSPFIYFWGITHDRSSYLLMEKYLECLRRQLETRPPPLDINELDQVCCLLMNHKWHRARVTQNKLSLAGTIEVFCIDSGDTHAVPLAFLRTLDIPGTEVEHVKETPPLATKFLLADIVAPQDSGSHSHWSEPAIMFLKVNVQDRTWKALSMGRHGGTQSLRLFYSEDVLLASMMIKQNLGVASSCLDGGLIPITNIVPLPISRALSSQEKLRVTYAAAPGSFFGVLEEITVEDMDDMAVELMLAYSSDSNPLLYADGESHLGHYGVVYWDEENEFFRIRVIEEFVNDAQVIFVDYGFYEKMPRCKIFSPIESLTCFRKSPFGIYCKVDDVSLSFDDWSELICRKEVKVKMGKCVNEVYPVTLTEISAGEVYSSSGHFCVNIYSQNKIFGLLNLQQPSSAPRPQQALPDADSQEEESSETRTKDLMCQRNRGKKNVRKNANKKAKLNPFVPPIDEEALSDHHLSDKKFLDRDQDNGSNSGVASTSGIQHPVPGCSWE